MTQLMATWSRANSKWQSMHLVSEYSVGLPPFHTGHLTILIHTGRRPSFLMTATVIHTKLYLSNCFNGYKSKHLKGQLGPPVSDENDHFLKLCPGGQLGTPVSDKKI